MTDFLSVSFLREDSRIPTPKVQTSEDLNAKVKIGNEVRHW